MRWRDDDGRVCASRAEEGDGEVGRKRSRNVALLCVIGNAVFFFLIKLVSLLARRGRGRIGAADSRVSVSVCVCSSRADFSYTHTLKCVLYVTHMCMCVYMQSHVMLCRRRCRCQCPEQTTNCAAR